MDKRQPKKDEKKSQAKKSSRASTPTLTIQKSPTNNQRHMQVEHEDKSLPYRLKGLKIYGMDEELADEVRSNVGHTFQVGSVIKGKKEMYKVKKVLGKRTYVVHASTSNNLLVMKTEASVLPKEGPILMREHFFLSLARTSLKKSNRAHFMTFVDQSDSQYKETFGAIFMNKAKFSLPEARTKKLNGNEFSPQTATRLCMLTLQAIHDVHLNGYVHRDIQPKNFFVGTSDSKGISTIYITGLGYSYDTKQRDSDAGLTSSKKLTKTVLLNPVFQSRQYHRHNETTNPVVDLDSWLFMCYDFFNTKALPWNQSKTRLNEREYLNQKEAFFSDAFDAHFNTLGIPPFLHVMRRRIARLQPNEIIDYPHFAYCLMQIANDLKVNWNEPFEWQKKLKTQDSSGFDEKEEKNNAINSSNKGPILSLDESAPQLIPVKPKKKATSKQLDLVEIVDMETAEDENQDIKSPKQKTNESQKFEFKPILAPKSFPKKRKKVKQFNHNDSIDMKADRGKTPDNSRTQSINSPMEFKPVMAPKRFPKKSQSAESLSGNESKIRRALDCVKKSDNSGLKTIPVEFKPIRIPNSFPMKKHSFSDKSCDEDPKLDKYMSRGKTPDNSGMKAVGSPELPEMSPKEDKDKKAESHYYPFPK